jgi:predicted PurR-regulated permease PerM
MADNRNRGSLQNVARFAAIIISIVAVVFILRTLQGIFVPLILAIFLSYLFAPVVEFLARYRIPRVATLFILLAVFTVAGTFFIQNLIGNVREFIALWPIVESRVLGMLTGFLRQYFNIEAENLMEVFQSARVQDLLSSLLNVSLSFIGKGLLTLIFLLFIYLSYHNYPMLLRKAFEPGKVREIEAVLGNINEQITSYFIIKTLISAGTGLLTGVTCALIGIRFPVLWGALAFLLNYIPYIGSLVAVVFPVLLSVLQFPDSYLPLVAFISLLGIQVFMGNYLDPEMMGNRFNLSPIIIIFSLFFWAYVWGVVGAFIAVPTMAIIKIILQNLDETKPIAVMMSKRAD